MSSKSKNAEDSFQFKEPWGGVDSLDKLLSYSRRDKKDKIGEIRNDLIALQEDSERSFNSLFDLPSTLPAAAPTRSSSKSSKVADILKNSRLFEEGPIEPREPMGKRKLKRLREKERKKTSGANWFNVKAPEMTQERQNDLEALNLRSALDTKRFYKRNTMASRPTHFHIGKILDNPADYYHSRIPKKERKQTIAEEFMAEAESKLSRK